MFAEKGNKVYTISEKEKAQYQNDGFDIKDDTGKLVAYGKGKMVAYEEYKKIEDENKKMKEEIEEMKKKVKR